MKRVDRGREMGAIKKVPDDHSHRMMGSNYVTVIPVEYPRNRGYSNVNAVAAGYSNAPESSGYGNAPSAGGYGNAAAGYGNTVVAGGYGNASGATGYGRAAGGYGNSGPHSGYGSAVASGGYGSAAGAGGYGGAVASGGYGSAAASGGYGSAAAASGYGGGAASGGYGSGATASGYSSAGGYGNAAAAASYNKAAASGYYVEQYSVADYPPHLRDDYIQTEAIPSKQTALYSVSQRVPPVNTNYQTLRAAEGAYAATERSALNSIQPDWEDEKAASTSTAVKEPSIEIITDTSINEPKPSTSAQSSMISSLPSTSKRTERLPNLNIPMCVYLHNRVAIMMDVEDTPSATCGRLLQAIIHCEEVGLSKQMASQAFALWMVSNLIELQLKPSQKPFAIWQSWQSLLTQYSHAPSDRRKIDAPKVSFQRNVFFPQHVEEKIKDQRIIELLYEEARYNVLQGRYPCEIAHYIMLGGIQARIELGTFNPQIHTSHYFREEQYKYLPMHIRKSATWVWLPISSQSSVEMRLLEQFKRVPSTATNRKLMKKYLEFCWSLPFYGSAFFEGQIEQPVRGLMSLLTHQDIPVLVAINAKGLYVIEDIQCTVLLGLKFEELSWEYARPSREDDPDCLPCLFIQFLVVENGSRVSKILQVFSKQASLMNTLITAFVNQIKSRPQEQPDNKASERQTTSDNVNMNHAPTLPSLANKLSKLTLATFDEDGHCIGQMGSWSLSY